MVKFPFLRRTAAAKGIGEPDTSFAVDRQVIGPVMTAPIQPVGQRRHVAVRLKAGDAMLPRLAPVEAALRIEHQAVGTVRAGAELGTYASVGIIPHDAAPRDMGEQESLAVPGWSFCGAAIRASE